jgi:hypothetical protein
VDEDYLWNRTGPADADLLRLEAALGRFRRVPPVPVRRSPWRRTIWPLLAAAALLLLSVHRPGPDSVGRGAPRSGTWALTSVRGAPRVGGRPAAADTVLPDGTTIVTDDRSTASLSAAEVGQVVVEPGSRLRVVASGGRHRLALDHGSLQVFIVAPPGRFVVETRSATAVDLGCVYRLRADEDGASLLSVEAGWVGFEFEGRESFVPAGASCRTAPGRGPGLPRYDEAPAEFLQAVEAFDTASADGARTAAVRTLLRTARGADAFTLWHVLQRVPGAERAAVAAALAARVPPPRGVTRASAERLEQDSLDRWWDAFGLGEAEVWRRWKQPAPPDGAGSW